MQQLTQHLNQPPVADHPIMFWSNETAQNTLEIIEEIQQFATSQHPKLQIHQQYSYINLQQPDLITAEALFLKLEENLQ